MNAVWTWAIYFICLGFLLFSSATIGSLRRRVRRLEVRSQAILAPLTLICPQCSGTWGKWSAPIKQEGATDSRYPNLTRYTYQTQTRTCTDCGYTESREITGSRTTR